MTTRIKRCWRLACFSLLCLLATTSLANDFSTSAPAIDCSHLNGTWAGYVTNPEKLFHDGGPWTIQLQIKQEGGRFIGVVDAGTETPSLAPDNVKQTLMKKLWGQCQQGKLSQVFLGSDKDCGHFAKSGLLVHDKMMLLHLPYENAMKNSSFTAILVKTSHQTTDTKLSNKNKVSALEQVKTCH